MEPKRETDNTTNNSRACVLASALRALAIKGQACAEGAMVAAAPIPQCVKIVALFDVKFVRHEHVVDPAASGPAHVGDIHCAVPVSFPVCVPEPALLE